MFEIPKKLISDVNRIVNALISYDNKKNLSWVKVYKEVLKELKVEDSNILLSSVVKELTNRGYDINDDPFKLESFR